MSGAVYRVIRHRSDEFDLRSESGELVAARARGKLRRGDILVGDLVTLDENGARPVIGSVLPRANSLIRPAVANVDLVVIVVAPVPEPDFGLVDKLIVNCRRAGVDCLICNNKSDLGGDTERLKREFGEDVSAVVSVSAERRDIAELLPYLVGKLVCFAGQSAVGKSTISNVLTPDARRAVGELSERIGRGRNTTTSAAIIESDSGFMFIDTPGFTMLDPTEENEDELALYYAEYVALADECRFHPCTHTTERDCAVRRAAEEGRVSRERYLRYLAMYGDVKAARKFKRR